MKIFQRDEENRKSQKPNNPRTSPGLGDNSTERTLSRQEIFHKFVDFHIYSKKWSRPRWNARKKSSSKEGEKTKKGHRFLLDRRKLRMTQMDLEPEKHFNGVEEGSWKGNQ